MQSRQQQQSPVRRTASRVGACARRGFVALRRHVLPVTAAVACGALVVGLLPAISAMNVSRAATGAEVPATWLPGDPAASGPLAGASLPGVSTPVEYAFGELYAGATTGTGVTITGSVDDPGASDGVLRVLQGDTLSGSAVAWSDTNATEAVEAATDADPAAEPAAGAEAGAEAPAVSAPVVPSIDVMGAVDRAPNENLGGSLSVIPLEPGTPGSAVAEARWQITNADAALVNQGTGPAVLQAMSTGASSGEAVATAEAQVFVVNPSLTAILEVCESGDACDPGAETGMAGWAQTASVSSDAEAFWRVSVTNTGNVPMSDVRTVTAVSETTQVDAGVGVAVGDIAVGETSREVFTTGAGSLSVDAGSKAALQVSVSGGFDAVAPDGTNLVDRFTDGAGERGRMPSTVVSASVTAIEAEADPTTATEAKTASGGDEETGAPGVAELGEAIDEGAAANQGPKGEGSESQNRESESSAGEAPEVASEGQGSWLQSFTPTAAGQADLRINTTQENATIYSGGENTYTTIIENSAVPGATGVTNVPFTIEFKKPNSSFVLAVGTPTCVVNSGAAVCPSGALTVTSNSSRVRISGTIPSLPLNSSVKVSITTSKHFSGTPYGTLSSESMGVISTVTTPSSTTEVDASSNSSTVNTVIDYRTQLVVSKDGDFPSMKTSTQGEYKPGETVKWEVTWTNNGPASLTFRPGIREDLTTTLRTNPYQQGFDTADVDFVSCSWTVDGDCPIALPADYTMTAANLYNSSVHTPFLMGWNPRVVGNSALDVELPAGESLTITYELTPGDYTKVCSTSVRPASAVISGAYADKYSYYDATSSGWKEVADPSMLLPGSVKTVEELVWIENPAPRCPTTDPYVKSKTGTGDLLQGDSEMSFTVTYGNKGPLAAGVQITDYLMYNGSYFVDGTAFPDGVEVEFTGCVWNELGEGLPCPIDTSAKTVTGPYTFYAWQNAQVDEFPVGAELTISYTVKSTGVANDLRCGIDTSASTNFNLATIGLTSGQTYAGHTLLDSDTSLSSNQKSVNFGAIQSDCSVFDIAVSRSAQATPLPDGGYDLLHTIAWSNLGDGDAANVVLGEYRSSYTLPAGLAHDGVVVDWTCEWSEGGACPIAPQAETATTSSSNPLIVGEVGLFPAGATLKITFHTTLRPEAYTCGSSPPSGNYLTGYLSYYSTVVSAENADDPAVPEPVTTNNSSYATFSGVPFQGVLPQCGVDMTITKDAPTAPTQAGDELSFTLTVTQLTTYSAPHVLVTDVLPTQVDFVRAECEVLGGGATTCPEPVDGSVGTYNPDTREVLVDVPIIGPAGSVRITVVTEAGDVPPGTFQNTATVKGTALAGSFDDPKPTNNSSTVTFGILNGYSYLDLEKRLEWGVVDEVPVGLTFTGTIVCEAQGTLNWSVTIPAGGDQANATITRAVPDTDAPGADGHGIALWNGDTCEVFEDPHPSLPAGYTFWGDPEISSDAFNTDTKTFRTTGNVTIQSLSTIAWSMVLPVAGGTGLWWVWAAGSLFSAAGLAAAGLVLLILHRRRIRDYLGG